MSVDEMSIRKNLNFDGYKTHGYVETGDTFENGSLKIASQALVVLLVGINNSFKIPIGYFLIRSATAEQRATIIQVAVEMCQEVPIKITNLTFDGTACNFAMARTLGCEFKDYDNIKPVFHI